VHSSSGRLTRQRAGTIGCWGNAVGQRRTLYSYHSYRAVLIVQIPKNMGGSSRKPWLADQEKHGRTTTKSASPVSWKIRTRQ
jgi:hypothetical protein